jgi:hypothetical protein
MNRLKNKYKKKKLANRVFVILEGWLQTSPSIMAWGGCAATLSIVGGLATWSSFIVVGNG